jgi:hypothetical protein
VDAECGICTAEKPITLGIKLGDSNPYQMTKPPEDSNEKKDPMALIVKEDSPKGSEGAYIVRVRMLVRKKLEFVRQPDGSYNLEIDELKDDNGKVIENGKR